MKVSIRIGMGAGDAVNPLDGALKDVKALGYDGIELLDQALAYRRDFGDYTNGSRVLDVYVALAAAEGDHAGAARLAGAVAAWRETSGARPITFEWPRVERALAAAEAALGPADFAAAYAEGRAMSLEQAVSLALRES